MTYDNIKSYKKPGLPFSLVHTFLENPQRGGVCVCVCVRVCVCVKYTLTRHPTQPFKG